MISPELLSKIAEWRAKSVAGTLTQEELKDAIRAMRESRMSAAQSSDSARRAKARKEIPSADSLLDELGGM